MGVASNPPVPLGPQEGGINDPGSVAPERGVTALPTGGPLSK